MRRREFLILVPAALAAQSAGSKAEDDVLLRAMRMELDRARTLLIPNLDKPYFIEYTVSDHRGFGVQASLGAVLSRNHARFRLPLVRLRVGDPTFDNANYIFSDRGSGSRYDPDSLPLDDDTVAIRRVFWLASDRAYKTAVEAIGRKRSTLKNVTVTDQLPDLWKADPVDLVEPVRFHQVDEKQWTDRIRRWSEIFIEYPEVVSSNVAFSAAQSMRYLVNSEGTRVRVPESLAIVQVRASGYAVDGTPLRDSVSIEADSPSDLPSTERIEAQIRALAGNLKALGGAPLAEPYAGPVLFEGVAGPQVFAELLGSELAVPRRPLAEAGRPVPFRPSDLEGRIGSRILPEFLSVVDDPTLEQWEGIPLHGAYDADEEGVLPKPLQIVEQGRLQNLLLTRNPVKGFERSNGRARLPGAFGTRAAAYSNLIVSASESVERAALRKKLLEMCAARNKPYGMIVRKMDYPTSATFDEIRRIAVNQQQSGSSARPVSLPMLMYRVYPDGREELVRGLQFRGFGVRSLRDITAVSKEREALHFLYNLAPFSMMGAGGMVAPVSVIAPSLLFDELELERPREDRPKLPLTPPPPLSKELSKE